MFVDLCPLLILVKKCVLVNICSFNFSEPIRFVNSYKPAHPVDSSNPMCTVDVLRSVGPVNSSKSVRSVDALKPAHSVEFQ